MFSLFSLNPLNAFGSAILMASARRRTQNPVAIALLMGWKGNREFCTFGQNDLDAITLGNIALGDSTDGGHIQTSIESQGIQGLVNKSLGYESLGNEHLGNSAFKSNPSVDSNPRQLKSGRYRLTPVLI